MPLQVGAIGSVIRATIVDQNGGLVDLSGSTLTDNFFLRRPDDTRIAITPTFETDGTDAVILYATVAGDITIEGQYRVQYRHVNAPLNLFTSIAPVNVLANITP